MWKFITVLIAAAIAIFLKSDGNVPLMFLPYPEKDAFKGSVIWITGASSGIGASLALDLYKSGAQLILSARRKEQLEEVAAQCLKSTSSRLAPMVLPLDVTDLGAQKVAVNTVLETYGRIDMLVLNAGKSQRAVNYQFSYAQMQELMHLNFNSIVHLTQLVLPSMMLRQSGHLVVMSSISGKFGTPLGSSYSASKFALHGYFDSIRSELYVPYNISVSIVCPGPVESDIAVNAMRNLDGNITAKPEGKKMDTRRATEVMAIGLYHRFCEIWIGEQPFLLLTHIGVYFPALYRQIMVYVAGPARVAASLNNESVMDVWKMLGLKK